MKKILTTLFVLIIYISAGYGQIKKDVILQIQNYLSDMEKVGFYGSVLVGINGKAVITKGFGFSNMDRQIQNSPAAIFDIGSITKQFTAAGILKMEMQNKLSTGDKLSKFFENVPEDKEIITIHDLLRHQSGLISNVGKDYEKIVEEEFLNKVLTSKLQFEPGSGFSYSNVGYSLLAMIIEKVSGQTYEIYLYENLFKPAQMLMTGYTGPDFDTNLIAVGYDSDGRIWGKPTDKEWDITAPYWHLTGNGGILSTTEDLYKWHKALMTDKILSEEAKQKLYHPELRAEETENSYYAYGWDVSRTGRNTVQVWHSGSNRIFYADFLRYIDEDIVFIMLSNKSHPNFNGLNRELSNIFFYEDYIPVIPAPDNEINRSFTNLIINTIEEFGLEKAQQEFQKRNPEENLLEFMMRNAGFNYIDNGKPEIAIEIFKMNVFAYPESSKSLQGLGEGYMETGNNELALKYLKQSLNINPENPFVKNMIKKIGE